MEVKIGDKTYEIKKFTLGESGDIIDQSMIFEPESGLPMPSTKRLRVNTIFYGVVKPKLTRKQIENMPEAEGMELFNAIRAYNRALPLGTSQSSS